MCPIGGHLHFSMYRFHKETSLPNGARRQLTIALGKRVKRF